MKKIATFFAFVMMNVAALCLTVGAEDAAKKPFLQDAMKDHGVLIFCVAGGLFLLIMLISLVSFFKKSKKRYLDSLKKAEKEEKAAEPKEKNIYLVLNGNNQAAPAQVQYIPVQQQSASASKEDAPAVAVAENPTTAPATNEPNVEYYNLGYVPCYCDYCAYSAYDYNYCKACCYASYKQERNEKLEKAAEAEKTEPAAPVAAEAPVEAAPIQEEITPVRDLEEEAVAVPAREFKDEGIKPEPLNPVIPVKPISPYDLLTPPADCPKCKQARDLEEQNRKKKKARNIAIAVTVAAVGASALKAAVKINHSKKRNRRGKYRR